MVFELFFVLTMRTEQLNSYYVRSLKLREFLLCATLLSLSLPTLLAFADEPALSASLVNTIQATPVGGVSHISPPEVIYHWTNAGILEKIAAEVGTHHSVPLVDAFTPTNFGAHFPEFRGHRGLFGWSHPVTAVGTESVEMYGDRPLKVWIRKNSRTALFVSDAATRYPSDELRRNYDVVLHVEMGKARNGKDMARLREWIVLNPDAIEKVSADPELIRKDIAPWFEKLGDPDFHFAENDLHFHGSIYEPGHSRDIFLKTKLRQYLRLTSENVPAALRGESQLFADPQSKDCEILSRIIK
jgi:hypothetical protein